MVGGRGRDRGVTGGEWRIGMRNVKQQTKAPGPQIPTRQGFHGEGDNSVDKDMLDKLGPSINGLCVRRMNALSRPCRFLPWRSLQCWGGLSLGVGGGEVEGYWRRQVTMG